MLNLTVRDVNRSRKRTKGGFFALRYGSKTPLLGKGTDGGGMNACPIADFFVFSGGSASLRKSKNLTTGTKPDRSQVYRIKKPMIRLGCMGIGNQEWGSLLELGAVFHWKAIFRIFHAARLVCLPYFPLAPAFYYAAGKAFPVFPAEEFWQRGRLSCLDQCVCGRCPLP